MLAHRFVREVLVGMPHARNAALLLLAAAVMAVSGCRALSVKQTLPEPLAAVPPIDLNMLVEDHNRNASLVQSLEAWPSVSDSDRRMGSASGRMALVLPRDFKLTLRTPSRTIADIGSNDREFWIWSGQSEEKVIYVGRYEEGGQIPRELAFQPDWVIEALGLKVLDPVEARTLTTERGDSASTVVLVHRRVGPDGKTTIKKSTVDRATGQIVAHQFYAPDGRTLVARATVGSYQPVVLESGEKVNLPDRIRLVAMGGEGEPPQDYSITLGVSKVKLNSFPEESRAARFAVPEIEGYEVVDVNERLQANRAPGAGGGGQTASYETLSPPPAGAGASTTATTRSPVRLERPQPLGRVNPTARVDDPTPLGADLPEGEAEPIAGGIDAVVTPGLPRAPGVSDANGFGAPRGTARPARGRIGLE